MEQKCQVDDTVSSSDQVSHGLASSTGENKTSLHTQRDTDVSTISSEGFQVARQTSIRSDVSSEAGHPLHRERKHPIVDRTEVSQGDPTVKSRYHYEQLKTESLSSKESSEAIRLSSVDSADPKPCQSSNEISAGKISQFKFDLNEDLETEGEECAQQLQIELKSSVHAVNTSEPVSVVAKVGIPIGKPKKPLQFGGELGWKRCGSNSAFRPTFLGSLEKEKGCANLNGCGSRQSLVCQGIDLNVAAVMESEEPEKYLLDLNCQSGNDENDQKPGMSRFDLNNSLVAMDTCNNKCQPMESRHMSRNCFAVDNANPVYDSRRLPYLVDLSRGFSHGQGRPFLVAAPSGEQVQMVVPIQSDMSFLSHPPSGFYFGKINGLSPTFYPPSVVPQMYPRTLHVHESHQGLTASAYANIRPAFLQNGGIALMENGSRGELVVPASSAKRREPHGGWDTAQINYRRMGGPLG